MGIFGKVAKIAKELTLGQPGVILGKYAVNKVKGKKKKSAKSYTTIDATLASRKRKRKNRQPMKKYKGMRGMKYTGKNKPITSITDRMQARRRAREREEGK